MISLILIWSSMYMIMYKIGVQKNKNGISIKITTAAILVVALLYSTVILGLINWATLTITFLNLFIGKTWFFAIALLIITVAAIDTSTIRQSLARARETAEIPIKNILYPNEANKKYFIILIILGILLLTSIGPISSSDTVRVYAGYPAQFLEAKEVFKDQSIIQGLMSIDNLTYLSFASEKTQWLWRGFTHFIALYLAVAIMQELRISRIIILLLIKMPIYISFLTQGKAPFLGDCAIACMFLNFKLNKDRSAIFPLLGAISIATSLKISSVLIALPMITLIAWESAVNYKNSSKRRQIYFPKAKDLLAACILLVLITGAFYFKYSISGNPIFPLFLHAFGESSAESLSFQNAILNHKRSLIDVIKLAIVWHPSEISTIIGIATVIGVAISIKKGFRENQLEFKACKFIALVQILLLLMFCQVRGDYYFAPIMIGLADTMPALEISRKNIFTNAQTKSMLISTALGVQLAIFIACMLGATYISIMSINEYTTTAKNTSYGYYDEWLIRQHADKPVIHYGSLLTVPSYLFRDYDYIDPKKVKQCLNSGSHIRTKNPSKKEIFSICMKLLGAKSYAIEVNKASTPELEAIDDDLQCLLYKSQIGTRNPFQNREKIIKICRPTQ